MAEDWLVDVQKYDPQADADVVAGIVRHCGIALRNRDSSLVSITSPNECARVRESFLKKKLGLSLPDSELDSAIAAVGQRMKEDHTKNRVTVYYLLSDQFNSHHLFRKGPGGSATPTTASGDAVSSEPQAAKREMPAASPSSGEFGAAAQPVAAAEPIGGQTSSQARQPVGEPSEPMNNWWIWIIVAIVVIVLLIWLMR